MYRKTSILISFLLLTFCLFAGELQEPDRKLIPVSGLDRGTIILPYTDETHSDWIDYEFVVEPTTVMTSYYDYMPGGYSNYPIQRQLENGSGTYLTFHATDSPTSTRRQYWAYYDENGNLQGCDEISTYNELQGYGDLVLHPATGNCIASWHEIPIGSNTGCTICYDDYALLNIPGFWSSVTFITSPLPDEYLWPRLYTGPSPNGNDWIRIYHISQNINPNSHGYPCDDVRIMYMDIENTVTADLTQILNLDNWTTVTPMYSWREKSCRPRSLSFTTDQNTPGKVSMIGYCVWNKGDLGDMPVDQGLFVWESFDYGETWDNTNLHSHNQGSGHAFYQVENTPQFEFNGVVPDYLDVDIFGYNNTALYDDNGNLHTTLLANYSYTDPETKYRYYLEYFLPQIESVWWSDNSEFSFEEIPHLPGNDVFSGQSVPWKITGNDTILYVVVAYPGGSYGDKQSNTISTINSEYLHCWSDATYATLAQLGYTNYAEYLEHPIIYLAGRGCWGTYKLLELTDINNPNFDFSNQITVYPYMADYIECSDYLWGKVYLYYLDDNSYGSYILGQGDNTGGNINYCIVNINLYFYGIDEDFESSKVYSTNRPNPFSANTHISFSSSKPLREASVKIYNAKGQFITTLESHEGDSPTESYATWNGKDMSGNDVANGIYFYKVTSPEVSHTGKMLLAR